MDFWGKTVPRRRHSECKAPVASTGFAPLRNSGRSVWLEGMSRGRVRGDDGQQRADPRPSSGSWCVLSVRCGHGRVLSGRLTTLTDVLKGSLIAIWGFYWEKSGSKGLAWQLKVVRIQVRAAGEAQMGKWRRLKLMADFEEEKN